MYNCVFKRELLAYHNEININLYRIIDVRNDIIHFITDEIRRLCVYLYCIILQFTRFDICVIGFGMQTNTYILFLFVLMFLYM